jgi:hypothetical protein
MFIWSTPYVDLSYLDHTELTVFIYFLFGTLIGEVPKLMPLVELEMMLVASDVSNRSTNFLEMAKQAGIYESDFVDGVMAGKSRILDTLYI